MTNALKPGTIDALITDPERAELETAATMWPWRKNVADLTEASQNPTTRCVACHTAFRRTPPETCPRCGADNRAWQIWRRAGPRPQLKRFFLRSPWGWLALSSLLLPLAGGSIFAFKPPPLQTLILALAFLLSLGGLLFFFFERERLWLAELMRRSSPPAGRVGQYLRAGLLTWGGFGFIAFLIAGGGLIGAVIWGEGRPGGAGPAAWLALLVVGLAFAGLTWAAAAYSLFAYGQWSLRTFPPPIFVNEAQLLALVAAEARLRLQLKLRQHEKLSMQVASLARTGGAEIVLKVQVAWPLAEAYEGHYLTALQPWRVVSNVWGHVKQLIPDGPVTHVPDVTRPYASAEASEPPEAADTAEATNQPRQQPSPEAPEIPETTDTTAENGSAEVSETPEAADTAEETNQPAQQPPPEVSPAAQTVEETNRPPHRPPPQVAETPESPKPSPPDPLASPNSAAPQPGPPGPALEGDLIFDETAAPATIEEAIILAVIASSYQRQRDD